MSTPNAPGADAPKWTPGPWRVATGDSVVFDSHGEPIAECLMSDAGDIHANAALIAAAPALYAALEAVEWSGTFEYGDSGDVCEQCPLCGGINRRHEDDCQLAAALAAARGE